MSLLALAIILTGAVVDAQPRSEPMAMVGAPAPRPAHEAELLRMPPRCMPDPAAAAPFASCFLPHDYPLAAWRARRRGTVGVRLTIVRHPGTSRCEVLRSSRTRILDQATCAMLLDRVIPVQAQQVVTGQVAWVRPSGRPVDRRLPLVTYFSTDDYPAAALRAEEQGLSAFIADIGVNGRVTACRITGSSGSSALDMATCRIIRSRTRYRPARDAAGRAVPGTFTGAVSWRLPPD